MKLWLKYIVCTLIFYGVYICGFCIFMDFAYLNLQILNTVVFKYSRMKYSSINHSQAIFISDALMMVWYGVCLFFLRSSQSSSLSRTQYSVVPFGILAFLAAAAIV